MFPIEHKIFVIIFTAYLTLDCSCMNRVDTMRRKCFDSIQESFRKSLGTNYEQLFKKHKILVEHDELNKIDCAKRAVIGLNSLTDDIENYAKDYYLKFEEYLLSGYIFSKKTFCSMPSFDDLTLEFIAKNKSKKKPKLSIQDCENQLNSFPDNSKAALIYAFYEVDLNDESIKLYDFAFDYMVHIIKSLHVKEDFPEPLQFCNNYSVIRNLAETEFNSMQL